jgi:hypothetical protein
MSVVQRINHKLKTRSGSNKPSPYRPPQYRRVMLLLIVLRRLDCVSNPLKRSPIN